MADTRLLMEELLVQVFGEKHRAEATKFFDLDPAAAAAGPGERIPPMPVKRRGRR
jgi:hypothetical protein